MFRFLQSKKGFTLVELMIVLVMLGFGAFAVINLSQSAWRSFHKSEERYLKQEAVKEVVNKLQGSATNVAAAEIAAVYDDLKYVEGDEYDPGYSYLYAKPDTFEVNGVATTAYRLFYRNANAEAVPVLSANSEYYNAPIYVIFEALKTTETKIVYKDGKVEYDTDGKPKTEIVYEDAEKTKPKMVNTCGVKVRVMAMENDTTEFISDNIFYELDVTYHFPNMATHGSGNKINISAGSPMDGTVDNNGVVLKIHVDSIIKGNNSEVTPVMACYIATASYGWDSGEVGLLCDFRDSVLMQSAPGRAFVKAYYTVSPPIAKVIAGSEPLKAAVRLALKPLVIVATFALDHDLLAANTAYIIIFMITTAAAVTVIVYCRRKRRKE